MIWGNGSWNATLKRHSRFAVFFGMDSIRSMGVHWRGVSCIFPFSTIYYPGNLHNTIHIYHIDPSDILYWFMILEDIWLVVGNMNGLWLSRNSWEWNGKIIPTVTHSIIFQRGRAKNHQADTHIHLYTLCIYNVHLMVNGYYLPIYHIIDKPYDSRSLTIYISIYLPYINHHFLMGDLDPLEIPGKFGGGTRWRSQGGAFWRTMDSMDHWCTLTLPSGKLT